MSGDDGWKSLQSRLDALKSNQDTQSCCDAPVGHTHDQPRLESESLSARFDALLGSNRVSKGAEQRRKKCLKTEAEEVDELMQAAFEHAQLEKGDAENKTGSDGEDVVRQLPKNRRRKMAPRRVPMTVNEDVASLLTEIEKEINAPVQKNRPESSSSEDDSDLDNEDNDDVDAFVAAALDGAALDTKYGKL